MNTREKAEALIRDAAGAERPSPEMSIGIHRFIGEVLRMNTPFTSPRLNCPAALSIKTGRAADTMFCRLVADSTARLPKTPASKMARKAITILRSNGIEPIRTQFAVRLGARLFTRIDALGIRRVGSTWKPCVIELKTTAQTLKEHRSTYDSACKRRTALVVPPGIPAMVNNERNAHDIQARFGALALGENPAFSGLSISAVVVVCTKTGACLYEAPPLPRALYSVPALAPTSESFGSHGFPRLPGKKFGGELIRGLLKRRGFNKVVAGKSRVSFSANSSSGTPCVGAIIPNWLSSPVAQRERNRTRLCALAGADTKRIVVYRAPTGWELIVL